MLFTDMFLYLQCGSWPVLFLCEIKFVDASVALGVCSSCLQNQTQGSSAPHVSAGSIARFLRRLPLTARCCGNLSDSSYGGLRAPEDVPWKQLAAFLNLTATKSDFESD